MKSMKKERSEEREGKEKKQRKNPEVIITPRDISLFYEAWRHGLITHKFCSEFYFNSYSRTRTRIAQLQKKKYLFSKRIYHEKIENIYYLTDKSLKLLKKKKPVGLDIIHCLHNKYLLELYTVLRKAIGHEVIRTEMEIKTDSKNYFKIPDLCFSYKNNKYAIEYERSAKSRTRYNEICTDYLKYYDPDKWIFVYLCEDSVIENKVKDTMKMKRLHVFNAEVFLNRIQAKDETGSINFRLNFSELMSGDSNDK